MTDIDYSKEISSQIELEAEINNLKEKISHKNSRSDTIKLSCLLSKYNRLYGNESRELKNTHSMSIDDISSLEREFHELNRYKESAEHKKNAEDYLNTLVRGENSDTVYVRAHFRKKPS